MAKWFDPYLSMTVIKREQASIIADTLADSRVSMFSCYDLGGVDNGDDWMLQLSGAGWKYSPIGLDFSRSVMGGTSRMGSILINIKLDGVSRTQWGCLACVSATADRVVMSAPYWGRANMGFTVEFLRIDSGTCAISMAFVNRGDRPQDLMMAGTLINQSSTSIVLDDDFFCEDESYSLGYTELTPTHFSIAPGETVECISVISIAATIDKCRIRMKAASQCDLDNFRSAQQQFSNPERLQGFSTGKDRQLATAIFNVMRHNVLDDGETFLSAPNRVIHKGQWLWDSCFHALAWNLFDREFAQQILLNLFRYQDENTGFIPINADSTFGLTDYATQPPLIAMALSEVCDDIAVLNQVYPKLVLFYEWLERNRMLPDGLFHWNTAGESGMDNSPRFDDDPSQPTTAEKLDYCCRVIPPNVAHIDISCMMFNFADIMGQFAAQTGQQDELPLWQDRATKLKDIINNKLFNEEDGFYYDRQSDGKWLRIKTVASFWALFSGICQKHHADVMVEHIMNSDEFFSDFPLPSVALNEPSFCTNYWRGPVWINTVYMTVVGMLKYGYKDQAREIVSRVRDGILREYYRTGHFWELYDPLAGPSEYIHKKHFGPRQNANGFCGWTANVLNLLKL